MYFISLSQLLYMDGHGPYVWACYALFALLVVSNLVAPMRRRRHLLQKIRLQQRQE